MDFCKLLVYSFLLNCPIEGKIKESGIPMEFLERFAAAHDGHATVVITEKDSGRYLKSLGLSNPCRVIKQTNVCSVPEK